MKIAWKQAAHLNTIKLPLTGNKAGLVFMYGVENKTLKEVTPSNVFLPVHGMLFV